MKGLKMNRFLTLGTALAALAAPALAEERRPTGELIAMNCGTCHGTYGRAFNDSMPPLAGMDPDKLVNAMIAFRDDTRPGTIMSRLAPAFTEEDYRAIAEYFAAQEPVPYPPEESE